MKKLFLNLVGVVLALSFSVNASAADASTNVKLGVVNLQQVLEKSPQMNAIRDDLKKRFGARHDKIIAAQNQFKKDADQYKKNSAVMSEADRKATEQKLMTTQQNLQQMEVSYQQELIAAQNKEVNAFLEKVKAAVAKIGKDGKYTAILIHAAAIYFDAQIDMTNQVISALK